MIAAARMYKQNDNTIIEEKYVLYDGMFSNKGNNEEISIKCPCLWYGQ